MKYMSLKKARLIGRTRYACSHSPRWFTHNVDWTSGISLLIGKCYSVNVIQTVPIIKVSLVIRNSDKVCRLWKGTKYQFSSSFILHSLIDLSISWSCSRSRNYPENNRSVATSRTNTFAYLFITFDKYIKRQYVKYMNGVNTLSPLCLFSPVCR